MRVIHPSQRASPSPTIELNGFTQATYNGLPLHLRRRHRAGQAKGNGLNLSGGIWHEVTTSGAAAPSPGGSGSSGGRLRVQTSPGTGADGSPDRNGRWHAGPSIERSARRE